MSNRTELIKKFPCDWRSKADYPTLIGRAKKISFDVETYDPNLEEQGPGALRKDGYICGFSIATEDGFSGYYPIRHEGGDNLKNPVNAIRWLKDQLGDTTPKIGANLLYDIIWLKCDWDIDVLGPKWDVQVAEPLIDENKFTYSLDALSKEYLDQGKVEQLLLLIGKEFWGLKPKKTEFKWAKNEDEVLLLQDKNVISQVKGRLWELPARYVGEYGDADAYLPIQIFEKQEKILKERKLWDLFEIETEILEMLLHMWIRGVPVDINKGEQVKEQMQREHDSCIRKIKRRVGNDIDIWSRDSVASACEKLGLYYPLTEKENPSFKSEWLADQEHPFFQLLLEARQLDRSGGVFIEEKILNAAINGRIHPQFWQVKTERYGTTSGRFSSSNPNAQQFPSRNKKMARLVRGLIIPEHGCEWGKADYSQQEYRLTVHYANVSKLSGAADACAMYNDDPDTDYHNMVAAMTGLDRRTAKNVNFGLLYGMGPKTFGEKFGMTFVEAKKLFNVYHNKMPYVKALTQKCDRVVKHRGYIKTLMGRHCHFDLFGPPKWEKGIIPKKFNEAVEEFGRPVIRYFTYKAINRLIQGGSADMIKLAMVQCYRENIIPCLTVHDELDFHDIQNPNTMVRVAEIMQGCVSLSIPMKVDITMGPNWGDTEEVFI